MVFKFNDAGREILFSDKMSDEDRSRATSILARLNRAKRRESPQKEDTRSFFDKAGDVGTGIKEGVSDWWDRYKARVEENREKHGYLLGNLKSGGESIAGMAEGAAINLPGEIIMGAKNLKATGRSMFSADDIDYDGESILAEEKRLRDMKKVKDFIPTASGTGELGTFLGAEGALTAATGGLGQLSKLKYMPRIIRLAAGGLTEASIEGLRTGSPLAAGAAGIAGGLGAAIPGTKKLPSGSSSLFSNITKKIAKSDIVKNVNKSTVATGLKNALVPIRNTFQTLGERGKSIAKQIDRVNLRGGELDLELKNMPKVRSAIKASDEVAKETGKWIHATAEELAKAPKHIQKVVSEIKGMFEDIYKKYDLESLGINKADDYVSRITNERGRNMMYSSHIEDAADELAKFWGTTKSNAKEFLEEIRNPDIDPEVRVRMISNPKKGFGKKWMQKSRKAQKLPDEWLETDIRKLTNSYVEGLSEQLAKHETFGKEGINLYKQVDEMVAGGFIKRADADELLKGLTKRSVVSQTEKAAKSASSILFLPQAVAIQAFELATNALRVGGRRQVSSMLRAGSGIALEEMGKAFKLAGMDVLAEGFEKTSKKLLKNVEDLLGSKYISRSTRDAVGSAGVQKYSPFNRLVGFAQRAVDIMNLDASVSYINKMVDGAKTSPLTKLKQKEFIVNFGQNTYDRLFDSSGVAKNVDPGQLKNIAASSHLVASKPVGLGRRPLYWDKYALGRVASQYKQFGFPVMETFLKTVTQMPIKQRTANLAGFMALGSMAGIADDRFRSTWKSLMSGKEPEKKDIDLATEIFGHAINSFSRAGSFAIAEDLLTTQQYSRSGEEMIGKLLGGPIGRVISTVAFGTMEAAGGEKDGRTLMKDVLKTNPLTKALIFQRFMETDKEESSRRNYARQQSKDKNAFALGVEEFVKTTFGDSTENKKVDTNINSENKTPQIEPNDANAVTEPLPPRKKGRYQCGETTNDWLKLPASERMGNTLQSKMDGKNFEKNGKPKEGGYFVMDTGTKYGHCGVVKKVTDDGIYITDSNYNNDKELREDYFIAKSSPEYRKIVGFGSA